MNKRGIKAGIGLLILIFLIIIVVSIYFSSAIIQQETYILGEKVKINLENIENYTLKIITPSTSYIKEGSNNIFIFRPEEPGKYQINVLYGEIAESSAFIVLAPEIKPEIKTDSNSTKPQNSSKNIDAIEQPEESIIEEKNKIVINRPVEWNIRETISSEKANIKIPSYAEDIHAYSLKDDEEKLEIDIKVKQNNIANTFSKIISLNKEEGKKSVIIENFRGEVEIEYITPTPKAIEKEITNNIKEVIISSPQGIHYEDVYSYSNVPELTSDKDNIKLYWKEESKYLDFYAYDKDGNGLLDYIEWITPHLSKQTFEIIVITKAQHLDKNREFISDIYDLVKEKDSTWSGQIHNNEYIKVSFEKNLTKENDITAYIRNTQNKRTSIEVYDSLFNKITEFPIISYEGYYKVLIASLKGSHDIFYLKIVNLDNDDSAYLEFDHIIDPSVAGFCVNVIACISEGATSADCTCSQANTDEGTYFGISSGNKGLETKDGNTAQGVINLTNSSLIPAGATITKANLSINYVASGTLNTCRIEYSANAGSWTSLRSDCTSDSTETTRYFDLSALNEAQLENLFINFTAIKTTGGAKSAIKVDFVNLTITYATSSAGLNVTLNYPANLLSLNTKSVNLNYTPGSSGNLINCSLFDNEGGTFSFRQANNTALTNNAVNQFNKTYSSDGSYLWNVQCFDNTNSTLAPSNFTFTIDSTPPNINLVSPSNASNITNSFDLEFIYNVTDISSAVNNCSIYVDNVLQQTISSITEDTNQSFFQDMNNGLRTWFVECRDTLNNVRRSENRTVNISINQPAFSERFWETSSQSFSSETAKIRINNSKDGTQNSASFTINAGNLVNIVNATSWFMSNNGALIPGGSTITFSSSFSASHANVEITWKLYITNTTGNALLCQNGDDGSGGTPTSGTISSSNSTCINSDKRLAPSDRLLLILDAYNTHGSASRSITHDWDASTSSYVDVNVTTEGFINVNLTSPFTDPNIAQGGLVNATCQVYCSIGYCRNVNIYIQRNSSTENWTNINSSGNLILGSGETNPHSMGNITSSSVYTNFTIQGNTVSSNNNIRCIAIGSYDSANGTNITTITVGGAAPTAPLIILTNPANATWFNTSQAILYYNVSDVNNNLANSTLILNGQRNQTNQSALQNSQINNFTIALPDGVYTWTVNATDTTNLEGTNTSVRTFYIDTQKPSINLSSPYIDQIFQASIVEFNFTSIDNLDNIILCNITIDSIIRDSNIDANNGSLINRTIAPISIGTHLWNVTCIDEAGNINTSLTRNFTIQDLPPAVDLITANNSFSSTGNITLIYNATDNNGFLQSQLILNNQLNQTNQSAILNGQYNNFTLINLADGIYTWNVNVTDTSGLNATNSTSTFTVDKTLPSILINSPPNNTISNSSTINFSFTAIDNLDASLTCNLMVGERQDNNFAAANASLTNRQITNFTDGGRFWNVTCMDDAGNLNLSETRFINITEKPSISLNTANNSFFNYSSFNLSYTPIDNTNLSSCSLYVDGLFNQTNQAQIINGQQNNFSISGISGGLHNWYVSCNDTINLQNQSETRVFTVDLDGLTVTLDYPIEGMELFTSLVNFTFNATDNLDPSLVCNITVNNQVVNTSLAVSGALTTRDVTFSQGGLKIWNVTCIDDASNRITSLTRNFTLAFAPIVSLTNPANGTFQNTSIITLFYNVTDDNNNLDNSTLILNGQRNQTNQSALQNSQINNFTIALPDGIYTWTINVTDTTNLQSSNLSMRTFTIDTQKPSIILNLPLNNSVENWNNITFNFSVIDNIDASLTCNLSMDGSPEILNFNAINGTEEIKYLVKQDGSYLWDVSCTDDSGNLNISQTRNFTVEAPPNISLQSPNNENITNINNITFTYFPSDPIGINNCSLFIDDIVSASSDTINNYQNNSFTINNIAEGRHNWSVGCIDVFPDLNFFKPAVRNFTVDITSPNITLNSPLNSSNNLKTVDFNFSAFDSLDADLNLSCNLYIDNSLNQSNFNIMNGSSLIKTVSGHSLGIHSWNVSCMDDAKNLGWSQKWQYNITLADLMVNSSSIVFNTTSPSENQSVLINATVYNIVNVGVENITVAFYNGDPDSGGIQIGQNQTIASLSPLSSATVSVNWNAQLGTNSIFAVVDPPFSGNGSIEEWVELNNIANNSITIGAWQFVYGNINSQSKFDLADESNNSVIRWESVNFESGNVYVADSESSILWTSLKAIGKNLTEGNAINDFSDLDSLLSITNYLDSISSLYLNSSGDISNVADLAVFNKFIYSVPIANSTNNTNFFTGMLWDSSDNNISNNGQFDTADREDIVLLTQINKDKAGAYGTYDYEMRIPARLREYRTAQTSSVVFYTEIN